MRQTTMTGTAMRTLALTLTALALGIASPGSASARAPAAVVEWSGVYRIEAVSTDEVVPMVVLVERAGERLQVTMIVDNAATALELVRHEGGELRGVLQTSRGRGDLVLRATSEGVAGTLAVGKRRWTVTGVRSL
jgi:hypothetical protein